MIPIDAAWGKLKPNIVAPTAVAKIPNCAAAANNITEGLLINGVKSHIAPIAINISTGNNSLAIPALYNTYKKPSSPATCEIADECGIFAKIAPKPIGKSNAGS